MTDQYHRLAQQIKTWGKDAGFQQVGITDVDLSAYKAHYDRWLERNYHGEMEYMQRHAELRTNPALLHKGTLRCISFRMDYLTDSEDALSILASSEKAYISRYALGRDYHRIVRRRLGNIAQKIAETAEKELHERAFVDSAPILERALAEKAGLGWIGKNAMLINSQAGSLFFLGEILTDLPLPTDESQTSKHCGSCSSCIELCPTGAITGPFQVDARRCISYLTIELHGPIPLEMRPLMGNRVFGCDDCQLVCPWNKFAKPTLEKDLQARHQLDKRNLLELYLWSEQDYLHYTEGSAIRRIGYLRWLRNLSVGLGNAPYSAQIEEALAKDTRLLNTDLDEHRQWALAEQQNKRPSTQKFHN